jgi:hypothetical protein
MKEPHTPGPWQIAETVGDKHHQTAMRRIRCENEGNEHGAVCEVYGIRDGTVAAANAQLIAAAPELLEQLTQLADSYAYWLPRYGDPEAVNSQLMQNVRAAIAKATA